MSQFLVVGVETVAGANIAASLAEKHSVTTWASQAGYEIADCGALDHRMSPAAAVSQSGADILVYCGPAARSAWEPQTKSLINDSILFDLQLWANAAASAGMKFVMVSSDAVFTSPWLFHDEESHGLCGSYQAQVVLAAEDHLQEIAPDALILRSNIFGWSPDGENGWIETLLKSVETKRIVQQDHIRHAAPILATDFAEILDRACQEELTGIYHVAGAERINPLQFTQRLADRFDLPWLAMRRESTLTELPQGFAEGECSLQTKKIRKDLCVAMPLLSEGIQRLCEQAENGFREKLRPIARPAFRRRAA